MVSDASYVEDPGDRLDAKKTVFVGALHGMITAHVLFSIMNELYGKVVFVGIDTDKYKYPIGGFSRPEYFRKKKCFDKDVVIVVVSKDQIACPSHGRKADG